MRHLLLLAIGLSIGCTTPAPELPWLHGVQALELSTTVTPGKVPDDTMDPCTDAAYARIDVVDGSERISASVAQGVQVFGPNRQLLERAAGESCQGVPRRIAALAVGTVARTRTIFVVDEAREGGAVVTRVTLYRSGPLDHLDRVFSGIVERRDADVTTTGELSFVRGRLLHLVPGGALRVWKYDSRARAYVPQTIPEVRAPDA